MSQITAKVIAHSINRFHSKPIITLQLRYPRFIHSELMTHRDFSRNASSSRAIPTPKMIEQVRNEPAMPVHWGKNQPGMQAFEEVHPADMALAKGLWLQAAKEAADLAEEMHALGLHKQVINRILEPFQYISVIVTATEWDNFFELRNHADADPTIKALAQAMLAAIEGSTPRLLEDHEWHLPYVTDEERANMDWATLCKVSAARCARVSYLTHDGATPSIEKDLALYERLVGSRPLHASPIEHQALPAPEAHNRWGNFNGWIQNRKLIEVAAAQLQRR